MRLLALISTFVLGLPAICGSRPPQQNSKVRLFVVPQSTVFTTVAYQPDSPIEFVRAINLGTVDGGGGTASFRLRNRGNQAILSYTIATVSSIGTGNSWEIKAKTPSEWIMPGQLFPTNNDGWAEILPLTDELRRRKQLPTGLLGVAIFMVVRAECADGTVFDDAASYKSLVSFFEENAITRPFTPSERK
jgi:hypothetical protein